MRRLGHRGLAGLLVLGLVVLTATAGEMIHRAQVGRKETIVQRFNTRHTTAGRFIEAYVRQIEAQQIRLGKQSLSAPTISPAAFDQLTRLNQFSSATLYDGDGARLAHSSTGEGGTTHRSQDGGLETALAGVPAVTSVTATDVAAPPMIAFAVPFQTAAGPRVFTGRYPVEDTLLRSFVTNALPTYRTPRIYLVNAAGTVIAGNRRDDAGLALKDVYPALAEHAARATQGFLPGHRQYYVSGSIEGTRWRLIFSLDTRELFETLTANQRYSPWAALAGFVLMGLGIIAMFVRNRAARTQAEDDQARQQAILETSGDAFIGTDDRGLVTDWNTAATRLLGWTRDEALGLPAATLMLPEEDRETAGANLSAFLAHGQVGDPEPMTITAQHRDGRRIPVETTISRSHWHGRWRFHAFMRDITERQQYERQLHELALTDSLTGLANRRAFLDQLDQAHARALRHGSQLAVLYGDVDHFKAINDTYGHAAGDAVLRQVSARLRSHFRTEDTVGRLGGDEFGIICEDFTSQSQVLVERLRDVLAAPYSFRDQTIRAAVSVGLALPVAGESPEHLLERADTTMYRAKAANQH